ncbi:AF4/FMR2 family member 1-like isoform X6 [Pipra filicauda]|uniref:AF4/FMR2 family member 1-like isoform X6 n=1 Tax=Pipra filicauda TaxID=649802 RepID=A0A7R5L7Z2_9PASS|nr:AF4/FMR2 family member 1-like isoform X6 [Pipra filicauda]
MFLSSVTVRRVMTTRFLNSHLLHLLLQDTVSVGFQLSLSSVTVRRVMTTRFLNSHLLHLLLQDTACSWTTCSSVTVRRAMTTNALKSQPRSVASSPSSSSETSDSESSVDWEMETTSSDGDVSDPPSAPAPEDTDGSAAQNQEQSGTGSGTLPSSQPRTSVLLDDLQLSDSEESDDNQVVEKPPSALVSPRDSFSTRWPRIPLQSQPRSVASSLSSSSESGSSSDSESSSGLETHQTVGIKRPGKPLVHDGSKRHRKEDSDPNPGDQGPVFQGLMLQSMSWDCSACSCKLWNAE